jgi:16S rRNA (uracil1498-N3)-methyltransferase
VERGDPQPVGTFYSRAPFASGGIVRLSEAAAHHARVKRLAAKDIVRLTNGAGQLAMGAIASLDRSAVDVRVDTVDVIAPAPPIHLRVPVADRDRMLWLAEKATELGVTTWQAVRFRRSMSVSPRGEGGVFADKLQLRMIAALEQSAGAWLPRALPDTTIDALAPVDGTLPIVLDVGGEPLPAILAAHPGAEPTVLVGPEGGIEAEEREALAAHGWLAARLATATLRFETAGIAAVAVVRAEHPDSR